MNEESIDNNTGNGLEKFVISPAEHPQIVICGKLSSSLLERLLSSPPQEMAIQFGEENKFRVDDAYFRFRLEVEPLVKECYLQRGNTWTNIGEVKRKFIMLHTGITTEERKKLKQSVALAELERNKYRSIVLGNVGSGKRLEKHHKSHRRDNPVYKKMQNTSSASKLFNLQRLKELDVNEARTYLIHMLAVKDFPTSKIISFFPQIKEIMELLHMVADLRSNRWHLKPTYLCKVDPNMQYYNEQEKATVLKRIAEIRTEDGSRNSIESNAKKTRTNSETSMAPVVGKNLVGTGNHEECQNAVSYSNEDYLDLKNEYATLYLRYKDVRSQIESKRKLFTDIEERLKSAKNEEHRNSLLKELQGLYEMHRQPMLNLRSEHSTLENRLNSLKKMLLKKKTQNACENR